jgi:iron complex outermembrane recepter protein
MERKKEAGMKNCGKYLLVVLAALLFAAGTWAQAPTGSIAGKVVDEKGGALPGVSVEISSPNLQGTQVVTTDFNGRFRVILLPAGNYVAKFTLASFSGVERTDITLGPGGTVTLNVQMRSAFKEEVVVTGTLIPRPTLEAMSPVATMDVEELAYQGTTRLEDLLTSLPQIFHAQNSTIANGASGTATIDLRYIGARRTLVLVDGRRLPAGDIGAISPDLNFIPAALVKRVDILTGGASSVYGADAVAGVVNFILDRDFDGVKAGISGGGFEHNNDNAGYAAMDKAKGFAAPSGQAWDGGQLDAYVALGGKFAEGKGHASLYLDYRQTAALWKNRRDYTNCSVVSMGSTGPACGGSGTWQGGRFLVFNPAGTVQIGDYTLNEATGNTLRNRTGADVFNYAIFNYMQRPDVRWAGGGFVDYEWNKHAHGYLEVMLMDDHTLAQIAPSGDFNNTRLVNCNNPMLSADEVAKFCTAAGLGPTDMANVTIGRRNVEGGNRTYDLTHEAFRFVAGLKGEINKQWNYDFYGLDAQTRVPASYLNDMNYTRIQNALIVDGNPSDPTTWHCRSDVANGCVPWNIFKVGGVTQAALNYLALPEVSLSSLTTQVVGGKVNADLKDYGLAFPSATEGIRFALGAEYRKENLTYSPDLAFQLALGSGSGGPSLPVSGNYSVKEGFAEFFIPIIQDHRWAKDLSLDLAYRYSEYNLNGNYPTWKAEGAWAPSADLKFRAGYNRATRAPNIVELFTPQGLGLGGSTDPCAGATPQFTAAQCALTGVTAAQYGHVLANPAQQYNTLSGGNPTLTPELANTKTFGLVITPSGLPGFTAAFDYFDIKITNAIGALGADDIIKQCLTTGNAALCGLIHRDVAGTLWLYQQGYTLTANANIRSLSTEGIDVNLTYALPLGKAGMFNASLIGTYSIHNRLNTGLYTYDCVGFFGNQCGDPDPVWRHLARFSWETGPLALTVGWRMVGGVSVDSSSPNAALRNAGLFNQLVANGSYKYAAYQYVDLAASYKLKGGIGFTLGVNNIADKEPPLGSGFSPNDYGAGFHNTYDSYGRFIHSSVTFTF